jgi:hypothetical protein
MGVRPGRPQFVDDAGERRFLDVGEYQPHAFTGEGAGEGAADTARRPGDYRHAPLQLFHVRSFPRLLGTVPGELPQCGGC